MLTRFIYYVNTSSGYLSNSGYIFSASLSLSVTFVVLIMFVLTFYLRHVMQGFM